MVKNDTDFMSLALRLAQKNKGLTAPNPTVGCVIVVNNEIIATGVTSEGGRPHAEYNAINSASRSLKGATCYVTLEPCAHYGKTAPCADLIIAAKISKVVIAAIDPDSRVNGSGIKKLKEAGIKVIVGVLEKEAIELNRGFFMAKQQNKPFVTLKIATSLDGKIATKNYDSKWISNQKSRRYTNYLRAVNDAILIGSGTAVKDNPALNCRINGLEQNSPKRIILRNRVEINENLNLVRTANVIPTFIISAQKHANDDVLEKYGVKIINDHEKSEILDLKIMLTSLCKLGINDLLIEGGNKIVTSFLKANLVDELIWVRGNQTIGNEGIAAIGDLNLNLLNDGQTFEKTDIQEFDDDVITTYLRSK